jgi:hypothetical protein
MLCVSILPAPVFDRACSKLILLVISPPLGVKSPSSDGVSTAEFSMTHGETGPLFHLKVRGDAKVNDLQGVVCAAAGWQDKISAFHAQQLGFQQ